MSEACHPKPHLTSRILSIKSPIETAHCSTSASTRASWWRLSSILSRCMISYTRTAYSIVLPLPLLYMVDVVVMVLSQAAFKHDKRSNLRLTCHSTNNNNSSKVISGADGVDVVIASTRLRLFVQASDTPIKYNYVIGIGDIRAANGWIHVPRLEEGKAIDHFV